jgi:hypothetical protein
MFQKFCNLLFIILIVLSFSSNIKAQLTIDSIIDNHLKVTGFLNFSKELKDFSLEGKLLQNNIGFPIKINGIVPGLLRMDMVFNQQTFIQISNGTNVWEYNPITDTTSARNCSNSEAQSFIDRLTGSLFRYKDGTATCRLIEATTLQDIEVYKLEFKYSGLSQVYFIDKYSYLILRIDDDFVENKITYYSDYKKVGNYYLPFSLTGYENGMPVMSMKFNSIKVDTGIPTTVFSKP